MSVNNMFIQAIHQKRKVHIIANTNEKGIVERVCIPFDYGPSRKYADARARYHFFDLDSPDGAHILSILPEQLMDLQLELETFDPAQYITWQPNWFTPRDWGKYS